MIEFRVTVARVEQDLPPQFPGSGRCPVGYRPAMARIWPRRRAVRQRLSRPGMRLPVRRQRWTLGLGEVIHNYLAISPEIGDGQGNRRRRIHDLAARDRGCIAVRWLRVERAHWPVAGRESRLVHSVGAPLWAGHAARAGPERRLAGWAPDLVARQAFSLAMQPAWRDLHGDVMQLVGVLNRQPQNCQS